MEFLFNLNGYFSMLIPVISFILLLSCVAFLMYLKRKCDDFFDNAKSIASDMKRIANAMDDKYRHEHY